MLVHAIPCPQHTGHYSLINPSLQKSKIKGTLRAEADPDDAPCSGLDDNRWLSILDDGQDQFHQRLHLVFFDDLPILD